MRLPLTRIKVSGITSADDAELAVAAGVDALACVFHPASPRYVTIETAWTIREAVPPDVLLVGIFVNTPLPIVERIRAHCGLERVQLFGAESRAVVDATPHAYKALSVATAEEARDAGRAWLARRRGPEPGLLLHLAAPIEADWAAAAECTREGPTLLASRALVGDGLRDAVAAARPWGVDVWEHVESAPGKLDAERLARLVSDVRDADARPHPQGDST